MSNYISLLLESETANRRLARLFRSEEFDPQTRRSIAMVTRDSSDAAQRETNSKMPQENRDERRQVSNRTRTVIPNIGSGATKRDLSVFSFMLALVLAGVVVAAHTDRPVFWLLVGPIPVAILHTTRTFWRERAIRRQRAAHVHQTGSNISENSSNKNAQADRPRIASAFIRRNEMLLTKGATFCVLREPLVTK